MLPHNDKISLRQFSILLLAAGASERMGAANKLTMRFDGKPLICHAVESLLAAQIGPLIVVTGAGDMTLREALRHLDVQFLYNPNFADGQASSIKAGLSFLPKGTTDIMIALADMPFITADFICQLVCFHTSKSDRRTITIPRCPENNAEGYRHANPTIWSQSFFPILNQLAGDQGGRQIFQRYKSSITYFDWPDSYLFFDIDTPQDLQYARGTILG